MEKKKPETNFEKFNCNHKVCLKCCKHNFNLQKQKFIEKGITNFDYEDFSCCANGCFIYITEKNYDAIVNNPILSKKINIHVEKKQNSFCIEKKKKFFN